jgi:hypothetical protein
MGRALYPHPQWARLEALWDSFYPVSEIDAARQQVIATLLPTLPAFSRLLADHRPRALRGRSLSDVLGVAERQPARLGELFQAWTRSPRLMRDAAPSLVFAVVGQARADGTINPEEESRLLTRMLTYWALRGTLDLSAYCAPRPRVPARAGQLHVFQPSLNPPPERIAI